METLLIIILIIIAYYWFKTGRKGQKLLNEIEPELKNEYGWNDLMVEYIWEKYNKEIVDMQLDGLSNKEIAQKLDSEYRYKEF